MIKHLEVLLLSCCLLNCSIEATDDEMIDNFNKNEDVFKKLVSPEFKCVESEKSEICKSLMAKAKIYSLSPEATISESINLDYKSFVSQNKGYLYSTSVNVKPLFNSLDAKPPESELEHYQKGYKKIKNNWYIYFEYLN